VGRVGILNCVRAGLGLRSFGPRGFWEIWVCRCWTMYGTLGVGENCCISNFREFIGVGELGE